MPDWRERETFLSGPEEMIDAMLEHWERRRTPTGSTSSASSPRSRGGEQGEGGEIKFLKSEATAESDGSKPILVAGEEAGLELPFGCREGICHTCIGKLCSGQRARHAKWEGVRHRRRDDPHLHLGTRRRNRDRAMSEETSVIESPLARLTDEQIEALGKEFDAIHDEVYSDLGDRDRRYIVSMIEMHRRLAVLGRVLLLFSRHRPTWIAGTTANSLAKILENMEIGHNVMHGQWDWMNDPYIHSSSWDWDTASTRRRGSTPTTTSTTRTRTSAARTRTSATRSCGSTRIRSGIRSTSRSPSTTSC